MHVDGFRFDLAPVLGETDLRLQHLGQTRANTVLQDIVDDPVLQTVQHAHHRRAVGAGGSY